LRDMVYLDAYRSNQLYSGFGFKEIMSMVEIKGIYNTAICFCDEMETEAEAQIRAVRRR